MEEKIINYQAIIASFLEEQASFRRQSTTSSKIETIMDTQNHHYQLLRMGWRNGRFVHLCLFHFDIIDGKIWLQQNRTDVEVGEYLIGKGVPPSDIVLGFVEPEYRKYSDFARA
jgi:hypothetical protein